MTLIEAIQIMVHGEWGRRMIDKWGDTAIVHKKHYELLNVPVINVTEPHPYVKFKSKNGIGDGQSCNWLFEVDTAHECTFSCTVTGKNPTVRQYIEWLRSKVNEHISVPS